MIEPLATGASSETWRNSSRARIDEICTSTTGTDTADTASRSATEVWVYPGVEHHTVVNAVGLLYGVDQLAFDIGLEVAESDGGIERPEPFEEGFEGLRTVNSGVAPPLQIEVRAVENQYFHSSDC